jgi:hypothetical protein
MLQSGDRTASPASNHPIQGKTVSSLTQLSNPWGARLVLSGRHLPREANRFSFISSNEMHRAHAKVWQ